MGMHIHKTGQGKLPRTVQDLRTVPECVIKARTGRTYLPDDPVCDNDIRRRRVLEHNILQHNTSHISID